MQRKERNKTQRKNSRKSEHESECESQRESTRGSKSAWVVNAQARVNAFNQNQPPNVKIPNVGGAPNVNVQANQAVRGVMMDRIMPNANIVCPAIVRPPVEGLNFELKPAMIQMLQMNQFGGSSFEDLNQHQEFL